MIVHLDSFIDGFNRTITGLKEFSDVNSHLNIDMDGIEIAIEGLTKMVNSIKDYEKSLESSTKNLGV